MKLQLKTKYFLKFLFFLLVICLILAFAAVYWLYTGSLTENKIKVFNATHLPIAKVEGVFIPMSDYVFRQTIAAKALSQTGPESNKQIFSKLVLEAETKILAARLGARVENKELDEAFLRAKNASDSVRKTSLESFLNNSGLEEADYKKHILEPELLLANLKIRHSSRRNLNPNVYILADSLFKQLRNGENAADLAKRFSDDPSEKSTGGDMGFIDPAQALPELKEPLFKMQIGEIKILPSRLGLHIIKAQEKQGNLTHFYEIFLKNNNFDNWFKTETQNFKIKTYLNLW